MNFTTQILPWNRVDKGLLIALFGLMTFGLLFVYSATYNNELFSSIELDMSPHKSLLISFGNDIENKSSLSYLSVK